MIQKIALMGAGVGLILGFALFARKPAVAAMPPSTDVAALKARERELREAIARSRAEIDALQTEPVEARPVPPAPRTNTLDDFLASVDWARLAKGTLPKDPSKRIPGLERDAMRDEWIRIQKGFEARLGSLELGRGLVIPLLMAGRNKLMANDPRVDEVLAKIGAEIRGKVDDVAAHRSEIPLEDRLRGLEIQVECLRRIRKELPTFELPECVSTMDMWEDQSARGDDLARCLQGVTGYWRRTLGLQEADLLRIAGPCADYARARVVPGQPMLNPARQHLALLKALREVFAGDPAKIETITKDHALYLYVEWENFGTDSWK